MAQIAVALVHLGLVLTSLTGLLEVGILVEASITSFFGDCIDGIRTFQPDTQRSSTPVSSITVPPAGLYITKAIDNEGLRSRVKKRADALEIPPRNRMDFLSRIEKGLPPHELPLNIP